MVDTMNTEKELNAKADSSKNEEKLLAEKKKQSNNTVAVCCGIPMGQRFNLKDGVVELKGTPMSHIVSAEKGNAYLPAGKYGVTVIKEEQWEEILAKYGKCDFIQNGIIFAEKDLASAQAKGTELKEKALGFEQADPEKGKTQKSSQKE